MEEWQEKHHTVKDHYENLKKEHHANQRELHELRE
jgi:hypothetical protein